MSKLSTSVLLLLGVLVQSSPVPNNPINTTIFNIESFFEQSFGNLAGSLIAHRKENSTQHYQTPDGNIQAEVKPLDLSALNGIVFQTGNHELIVENETTLFNNGTDEIDLAKVDLGTPIPALADTTGTAAVVKAIPSTVSKDTTTSSTEGTILSTLPASLRISTTNVAPVIIVTAITESTAATIAETVDINDKIKEVEAEPVILSSGV